ncbi:MAG: LptF/LptG family permease [Gemmatimonadales bacterium]
MRMLRRYILRSLVAPFLFALAATTGLMLVNQLAKKFGDLVGKDLPWQTIAEVLALSMPFIIALTLPMAVLVAILYGYSQLGADNEITAMRASGVGVLQMIRPALWVGFILMVTNFVFVDQILPRTNARLRNLQSDIGHKKPAFALREQAVNEVNPYFIRASRVFSGSGRLRDIEIYDLSLFDGRRVIYADSGVMAFAENQEDLLFQLWQGKVHEFKSVEPGRIQVTRYDAMTVRVRDVQNTLERNLSSFERGDREMTTCEMMDHVSRSVRRGRLASRLRRTLAEQDLRSIMHLMLTDENPRADADTTVIEHCGAWRRFEAWMGSLLLPEEVQAQEPPPPAPRPQPQPVVTQRPGVTVAQPAAAQYESPTLAPYLASFSDVLTAQQDARSAVRAANQYRVEIHKKYTISVACFTFVLIGVPLALRYPRGGMGLVLGGGLAIFALFYVSMVGGESLADRNFVSPALAMWFPNILVVVAGLIGLYRVRREFGSTRGGDLSELAESLKALFRFRRRAA